MANGPSGALVFVIVVPDEDGVWTPAVFSSKEAAEAHWQAHQQFADEPVPARWSCHKVDDPAFQNVRLQ